MYSRLDFNQAPRQYGHILTCSSYANELFYLVATGLIKISILLFYRRLKDASISRRYLWIIYASIAFVAAYSIQCIILLIFNCTPISDYWNQLAPDRIFTDRHPNCVGEGSSLIANTAISLSQDFVAAVVPTYLFWTLTLDRKNKLLLAVVFVVAYATCAIGCIRLYYIYYVFYRTYDVPCKSTTPHDAAAFRLGLDCSRVRISAY